MPTLFEKILDRHVVMAREDDVLLYIDRHLVHEVTSPQALEVRYRSSSRHTRTRFSVASTRSTYQGRASGHARPRRWPTV